MDVKEIKRAIRELASPQEVAEIRDYASDVYEAMPKDREVPKASEEEGADVDGEAGGDV